jgi:hypothetical protein
VAWLQALGVELSTRLTVVRQTGREEEGEEPTDKWTAEASTAGQRAIHLGKHHKGWAVVPPTGLQRSAAVANKHLKQNLAVCSCLPLPIFCSLLQLAYLSKCQILVVRIFLSWAIL